MTLVVREPRFQIPTAVNRVLAFAVTRIEGEAFNTMGLPLPETFDVPLFPLPDVVLFPGMLLPLHVFEDRYRILLKEALEGPKLIAIGHLQPGWENAYEGSPPVYEILGVGRIAAHQELEDGSSSIALVGLARCRLDDEPQKEPYRIATVTQIHEQLPDEDDEVESEQLRSELLDTAQIVMRRRLKPDAVEVMEKALKEREKLGQLVDFIASVFVQDPKARQALLENGNVFSRARMLQRDLENSNDGMEPMPPPFTGRHDDYGTN